MIPKKIKYNLQYDETTSRVTAGPIHQASAIG